MKYTKITSYKYELHDDFEISLPELPDFTFSHEYFGLHRKKLYVCKGYAWDGVSGPTIDTKDTFVGGLVHDVLYQAIREGFLPPETKSIADKIFHRLLLEHGMNRFRAKYFYLGVKWFGKSHIKTKKDGEEMEQVFEV